MADNYTPDTDSDAVYAADEVSSVKWPYVKLAWGADNTATVASTSDPIPVQIPDAVSITDGGTTVSVDDGGGSISVDLSAAIPAGANTIGNVTVSSMPAVDRTTDNIGVAHQTDVIMNDTTALTPKFAVIDHATSGDNTIVAAVPSKKIRVTNVVLVASGTVTARFESGAGGTALTGQMQLTAQTGFAPGFDPTGHFETASGQLLNLELSGAVSVDGWIKYIEV